MLCVNCHSSVTDTFAPRIPVKDVTFPSPFNANMGGTGATDDSNVCLLCHQRRMKEPCGYIHNLLYLAQCLVGFP
jgi:hypothetical protein